MADNLKVEKCTVDSDTVKQMKYADKQMETKKGISFYCSRRHEFIFIESVKGQTPTTTKIHHVEAGKVKLEIPPNIRTKQWD